MQRGYQSLGWVALVVALALVIAACGGDDEGANTDDSTEIAPQPTTGARTGSTRAGGAAQLPNDGAALAAVAAVGLGPEYDQSQTTITDAAATRRVEVPAAVDGRQVFDAAASFVVSVDGQLSRVDRGTGATLAALPAIDAPTPITNDELAAAIGSNLGEPVLVVERSELWWPVDGALLPVTEVVVVTNAGYAWRIIWDEIAAAPILTQAEGSNGIGDDGCAPDSAGQACVYAPDPDNDRRTEGDALRTVTLEGLQAQGVLAGEHVFIVDAQEPELLAWLRDGAPQPPTFAGPPWDASTPEQSAAINAYFWIDYTARHLDDLGWNGGLDAPIAVVPLSVADKQLENAHYQPIFRRIVLGVTGSGSPMAEDTQVVIHEYAHALFDAATPALLGTERQAYNEASADVVAVLIGASLGLNDPACVAPWVKETSTSLSFWARIHVADPGCLRRLDTEVSYPDDVTGEKYADGRIWSGALWDIFEREVAGRGGSITDCVAGTTCAAVADDVLLTLVESWGHLPSRRFWLGDAAAAFSSANEALGRLDVAHLNAAFDTRGLVGDRTSPTPYAVLTYADNTTAGYHLVVDVRDASGASLCTASETESFVRTGGGQFAVALSGCDEYLPPGADQQWAITITPTETSSPGRLIEFAIETATATYRSGVCNIAVGDEPVTVRSLTSAGTIGACSPQGKTDRATRLQAVVALDGRIAEVDGEPPALDIADLTWNPIAWVGPDRTLVLSNLEELRLWLPALGVFASAECVGCGQVVEANGQLVAIDDDRQLQIFSLSDLSLLRAVTTDLPEPTGDFPGWSYAIASYGSEVFAVQSDPAGTSASGGPEQIWAIDVRSGGVRLVADTEANISIQRHAVSPDGNQVALGGLGWRNGFCSHSEGIDIVDLRTGEISQAPMLADLGDVDGHQFVIDMFWNGPELYAVFALEWAGPFGDPAACADTIPTALYRLDGDGWEVVDSGPLDGVRPLGPDAGHKLVVVNGGELYAEAGGAGDLLTTQGRIVASVSGAEETNLTPPSPPAVVADTRAAIRTAAEAGDIDALVDLTGPGFEYSFGEGGDVASFWASSNPSDAIVAIFAGPATRSGDGAYSWNDQPTVACRGGIDADGTWTHFVCGD